MSSEKEFCWMIKLLNCKYIKDTTFDGKIKYMFKKPIGGCKKDFEIELGLCENQKTFRRLLNRLIHDEVIEFFERKKVNGKYLNMYIVDYKKMEKLLKEHKMYKPTKNILNRDVIIGN